MPHLLSNSRYLIIALLSLLFCGCGTPSMREDEKKTSEKIESQPESQLAVAEESQVNQPPLVYINSLPAFKSALLQQTQPMRDTGITSRMVQAEYDYIESLTSILVTLANYYSPKQFTDQTPQEFFSEIIESRFRWHYAIAEPHGPGTGGTIVRVLCAGSVAHDIEIMIEDMVFALALVNLDDNFNFVEWKKSWRTSAP